MNDKLRKDIYLFQGTNSEFLFDINVNNERYEMSPEDKLVLGVRDYRNNNQFVISKEITGSNIIVFTPEDTNNLDIGYYIYNVKLEQNSTGNIYEIVSPSNFWIKAGE